MEGTDSAASDLPQTADVAAAEQLSGKRGTVFRQMASAAGATFVIQTVGLAIQYGTLVAFARWCVTNEEFGIFALARSWMQVLGMVAALGLPAMMLRFVPLYRSEGRYDRLNGILKFGVWVTLLSGGGFAIVGAFATVFAVDATSRNALLLGMACIPLFAVTQLQVQMIRGFERVSAAFAPSYLIQPLLMVLFGGVTFFLLGHLTGVTATAALCLSLILLGLIQYHLVRRSSARESDSTAITWETKDWWSVSLPLAISSIALIVLRETDVILLGFLRPEGEVGIYMVVNRTARFSAFGLNAVASLVAPLIAPRYAKGDLVGLQEVTRNAAALILWPTLMISASLCSWRFPF